MIRKNNGFSKLTVDLVLIEHATAFGGAERHTVELIHALQQKGFRIAFIESGQSVVSSRICTSGSNITVISTQLSMSPSSKEEILAWKTLLQTFKTDRVLIVKQTYSTGSAKFFKLLKTTFKKVLSIEHSTVLPRNKWSSRVHFNRHVRSGLWWYREYFALKRRSTLVDHVITVSNFNKLSLIENALIPSDRITTCPNGIDTNFWRKEPEKAREFRRRFNIPDDAFLFGCVGRLTPEKGFELAVDAFKKIHKDGGPNNSYLIIIGEGKLRNELESHARDSNGTILFAGFLNELVPAYSAMDIGLFTSHHEKFCGGESFGLALIEAMSCECGVIAMSKGATTEVIGERADVCELLGTRDVDAWSVAMRKYAGISKNVLSERGAKLRKHVIEHYDVSSTNPRLIEAVMTV